MEQLAYVEKAPTELQNKLKDMRVKIEEKNKIEYEYEDEYNDGEIEGK
jgi:hypothetical protein